jgi:uncharacterized membrane protein SirB2
MQTGFLHTHTLVVGLFLAFYLFKTILLLAGKIELLDKVRNKTKIVDTILGTLILVTGGYLISIIGVREPWLWVKTVAVTALIPVGIIGMKRHNKALAVLALVGFIYFYGVAETQSLTMKRTNYAELATAGADAALYSGQTIYQNECVRCHGADGAAGVYNAGNLQTSVLNAQQAAGIIMEGKGKMKGYKKRLNQDQALAVAEYVQTLKR